ncbi:pilus assembly protein FimV [Oxalobacteraceae bacterium GrIS 1.11]
MPVNTCPRVVSFALKTLASAVACAVLLSPSVQAAGLGKLTVLSSLGQPLRAEIELTSVANEEAAALVAKLAPADAFRLANIDFNPTLLSLRFVVEQRNGRQFIRITSSQAVNEPFVDMLLELSWNSGRLVREYTFLLDPADLRQTQSAQVAAPVDLAAPRAARPAVPAPAASAPAPASRPSAAEKSAEKSAEKTSAAAPRHAAGSGSAEYQVKAGDSLGRIAGKLKPTDISLDAMLVALYRANPEAFNGNNMNRLRSGRILSVPDSDAIHAVADSEARGVVVAHAADFTAYRNKLAGQVALSAPAKQAPASQSATGKITAKVEERATPANESKDQLKLTKPAASAAAAGKTAVAGVEDKIAKAKQVADAAARVKELEKNVSDLEKLMTVKNKAMQEQAAAASAKAVASAPAVQAAAPAVAPAVQPAVPPVQAPASASAAASEAASAPLPAPVIDVPAPLEAKPKPKALIKPPPPPEPSLMDMAMDNIGAIGIGLAALLAGAAALVVSRRKKNAAANFDAGSVLGDPGDQAHSLFAETGGQSVDTNNSVFNSNFAPSASQLDTNEVDPIAEADVYIAYGRDAQAEEILKEALRMHPERHQVRLKLLEIYAARKDTRSFEVQASELFAMSKGQGDEWQQAAALGLTIEPLNPLYNGSAAAPAAPAPAAPTPVAPTAAPEVTLAKADPMASHALDLDLSHEITAAPVLETALPTPPASESDHFLDFDLGGLSFEPVTAAPAVSAAPPAPAEPVVHAKPAAEPAHEISFEMPPVAPVQAPAAPAMFDAGMDFPLDLAPPAAPHAAPHAEPESFTAAPVAEPLMDLGSMNFDLPTPTPPAPPVAEPSLDDFFAKPALPVTSEASTAVPEFDLSGIDLDLDVAKAAQPGADDPLSAIHMEMDTKLDLAIAYQEIGDKEGARELIDEVIKGGSAAQVAKANSMRALLG